jgi:flagellar basal-body rod protein FlgB
VAYLENLFGSHADRLERSLDRTSMRQSMLVKNLANVNTPGYKRQDTDFNITLENEMDEFDVAFNRGHLRNDTNQSSLRLDKNNVDMEHEVMSIAETSRKRSTI